MASVTLTLTSQCAGGGHLTLTLTGDIAGQKETSVREIEDLLQTIGKEEIAAAILRIAKIGRTNAQLKTLLQSGITVTV